jgi:hypothetical protein
MITTFLATKSLITTSITSDTIITENLPKDENDLLNGAVADTVPTGWINNGNGTYSALGTQLGQLRWVGLGLINGQTYRVEFDILTTTSGSLASKINGVSQGPSHTGEGAYFDIYTAIDNDGIQLVGQTFTGTCGTPRVYLL